MRELGLTGGIGSGKSTVGAALAQRGAVLVDADAIVRELQEPGEPVFVAMVDHFGDDIVGDDGRLDRPAVAAIVFSDADQLMALNAMVHPAVNDEIDRRRGEGAAAGQTVVLDVPLMVESLLHAAKDESPDAKPSPYANLAGMIVVDVPVELAVERLVKFRGFDADDARARMANQVDRSVRLEMADFVVDNSGSLDDLDAEIARCWAWIESL